MYRVLDPVLPDLAAGNVDLCQVCGLKRPHASKRPGFGPRDAAGASMGLMATINLIAILLLSGTIAKLTKDYVHRRKRAIEPVFRAAG
ncbi:hypothetical protein D9M72_634670 [compost metagenome]